MSFYKALANSEVKMRQSDGEFITAGQRGTLEVVKFVKIVNEDMGPDAVTSVILSGRIASSTPLAPGVATQPTGTLVKVIYSLAKWKFHKERMLADLCTIGGKDPSELLNKEKMQEFYKEVFEDNSLGGVIVNFVARTENRPGKTPITQVSFSQVTGEVDKDGYPRGNHPNTEEKIKARAASNGTASKAAAAPF